MANYFDQFDTPAAGANYFDQFDAPSRAAQSLIGASAHVKPEPGNMLTDILPEIASAASNAISSGARNLNPFSEDRRASIERQSKMPFFSLDSFKEQFGRLGSTGGGMMAPLDLAASPIVGAGRSIIGHGMEAVTPGMSYEQGKEAADKAMMAMRPAGMGAKGLIPPKTPVPSAPEIKSAAKAGYDEAANSGIELSPDSLRNFSVRVQNDLTTKGIDSDLAEKTFKALARLEHPPEPGATVTANNIRTLQRKLGHIAGSIDPTERLAATEALKALSGHIENLSPADMLRATPAQAAQVSQKIKEANANYSAVKSSEKLDARLDKADLNAGAANSGQNLENALRQQVKGILQSQKERRGYTTAELRKMDQFVRGKSPANVLRGIGNLLGGGGGLGAVASGSAGGILAGPIGMAAPAVGWGVKQLGNALASRKVGAIDEMIRARSPFAQSLPSMPALPPNSFLGTVFPYGLPQSLPALMGAMKTRAEDEERISR